MQYIRIARRLGIYCVSSRIYGEKIPVPVLVLVELQKRFRNEDSVRILGIYYVSVRIYRVKIPVLVLVGLKESFVMNVHCVLII
jgi:hypothetical protein